MNETETIVLFDGECALCSGLVQFIIRHDKKNQFRFAPLQSPVGKKLLEMYPLKSPDTDSVVLISRGKSFIKSEAIFRITDILGGGWQIFKIFKILPRIFSDFLYDINAKLRYRIFGKKNSCMMPSQDILKKFLA